MLTVTRSFLASIVGATLLVAAPGADAGRLNWMQGFWSRLSRLVGFDATKPGRFVIFRDKAGEYRFRLLAANNKTILASEGYKEKAGVLNGIASVIATADNQKTAYLQAANGQWYFVWRADNYQVTGTSETYVSRSNAVRGADAVRAVLKNNPRIFWFDGKKYYPTKLLSRS